MKHSKEFKIQRVGIFGNELFIDFMGGRAFADTFYARFTRVFQNKAQRRRNQKGVYNNRGNIR